MATYFNVTADYSAFAPGSIVCGEVLFTPVFADGDVAAVPGSPGVAYVPASVPATISGGVMTAVDGSTLQLIANVGLGLSTPLYYRVDFSNVTLTTPQSAVNPTVVDTRRVAISPFTFAAPNSSTPLDLITVTPAANASPATGFFSVDVSQITASGTRSSSTYLRGDGTWASVSGGGGSEPAITAGTSAQYWRGDKTWQTLNQDVVPSGTTNKVYTATEQTKLAGIAAGATANSTDAYLLNRANHTGTMPIAGISATGTPSSTTYLRGDGTWATVSGGGSVTSASVVSANGFNGSVATATSTPAITIGTSVTGLLKGNGTGVAAASAGTDFEGPITAGTTSQYWRGDKSWQTLNQDVVPSGTTNKSYTATEQTKLAGIAAGATANSSDATLLNRANHTGTQLAATVSDFASAADARIAAATSISANTSGSAAKLTTARTINGVAFDGTANITIGGGGISRNVSTVSSTVTLGATASTDYVVFLNTGAVASLPTAVGNTNLYTLKNISSAILSVATTSSQTIDGSLIVFITPNTSLDVVSDGANWRVV